MLSSWPCALEAYGYLNQWCISNKHSFLPSIPLQKKSTQFAKAQISRLVAIEIFKTAGWLYFSCSNRASNLRASLGVS
jgi:hypothetical protein